MKDADRQTECCDQQRTDRSAEAVMARLSKVDVEQMMAGIDAAGEDAAALCSALHPALTKLHGKGAATWRDTVTITASTFGWDAGRVERLLGDDIDALFDLAAELNEERGL